MRFEGALDLIRLAFALQGTGEGLTLDEIEGQFGWQRRKIERMRTALEMLFPQLEQANPGERPKRWRLPSGTVNGLTSFAAEELAELQNAIKLFERENLTEQAECLKSLSSKVRALSKRDVMRRVEPDLEALIEAEGLAMRPGPRPMIKDEVLAALREAIKANRKVRLHYRARTTGSLSRQIVCPYGFLYGNRHYLVAYSMNPKVRDYRLFSLSNIERVDVTEWSFERREEFSLQAFAEQSFGVFQEESFDVAWKFSPEAAPDAREFQFHPSQVMEEQPDGSLIVRFRAGGVLEMSWHLFTWGDEVEVLEPKDFWGRIER